MKTKSCVIDKTKNVYFNTELKKLTYYIIILNHLYQPLTQFVNDLRQKHYQLYTDKIISEVK